MAIMSLLPLPTVNVAALVNAGFSPQPGPVLHRIALPVVSDRRALSGAIALLFGR